MRATRWLLLLAIVFIVGAVGVTYYSQRSAQEREAPPAPPALPENVAAEGDLWTWTHTVGDRPVAQVRAARMRQVEAPSTVELEQFELRLFDPDGKRYDRVQGAFATLDIDAGDLYSEGEIEVVLGVPRDGTQPEDPVTIRSSGVRFDVKTGRAQTDRATGFVFGLGVGRSLGAVYEPEWGELEMLRDVYLEWRGGSAPMQVEAGYLRYKEDDSRVYLSPWSRFLRETLRLEAGESTVTVESGVIRVVEAKQAKGTSTEEGRELEYSAEALTLRFTQDGAFEQIVARGDARLVASSNASSTTVRAREIFLDFRTDGDNSYLTNALARGEAVLESVPVARSGTSPQQTRVLRSEVIKTVMRPSGRDIEVIQTEAPGKAEFVPNQPGQARRELEAGRLAIHYGDDNQVRSVRAVEVATRTEEPNEEGAVAPQPILTWSTDLEATFEPATGEMALLEQWGDFRYQQGAREARADRASLNSADNTIALSGRARVWDAAGSTAADRILLDRARESYTAEGRVSSTQLPDSKGSGGGLLRAGEPLHATAHRISTAGGTDRVLYEGGVVLWQNSNRLEAERVEMSRETKTLVATGNVRTRLAETGLPSGDSPLVYTVVRAPELEYRDENRQALYRGGARLERGDVDVKARELRAVFVTPAEQLAAGGQIERVLADGEVEIVVRRPRRVLTGAGEHAEYYLGEEKIILRGGGARLADSLRGTTEGKQLTYFATDDRLLVEGAEAEPVESRLRQDR